MSTPRWSLRLPRAIYSRYPTLFERTLNRELARAIKHKRWLSQRPPPRTRPWPSPIPKDSQSGLENGQIEPVRVAGTQQEQDPQPGRNTQLAAALAEADTSDLVTEVHIPNDPDGVLPPSHPASAILGNSSLVIQRQLEMMNVMLGFEQANKYIIMDGQGQTLGYIAEQDHGIGRAMARQMFRTHRSFTAHIFDAQEREVLRIHRPFAYINSRIRIYDPVPPDDDYGSTAQSAALQGTSSSSAANPSTPTAQVSPLKLEDMRIIGEAQQQWAPLRRKYNLFSYRPLTRAAEDAHAPRITSGDAPATSTTALTEARVPDAAIEAGMAQFALVDEPFLSWDFSLRGAADDEGVARTLGSVNRNFAGFAREIFTDTGVYALRMDSATAAAETLAPTPDARETAQMTLDRRAVMLATAVSIDFDYFSRHSHAGGGGFMPIFWPMGGGAAEGGAAGAGAGAGAAGGAAAGAGEAGAIEGAAGAVGGAAGRGLGTAAGPAGESAIAGAGTMAGYEAMQRGVYGSGNADDASPINNEPFPGAGGPGSEETGNRQRDDGAPNSDEVWFEHDDPWGGERSDGGSSPSAGDGGGEGGGGGGWLDSISDFFSD